MSFEPDEDETLQVDDPWAGSDTWLSEPDPLAENIFGTEGVFEESTDASLETLVDDWPEPDADRVERARRASILDRARAGLRSLPIELDVRAVRRALLAAACVAAAVVCCGLALGRLTHASGQAPTHAAHEHKSIQRVEHRPSQRRVAKAVPATEHRQQVQTKPTLPRRHHKRRPVIKHRPPVVRAASAPGTPSLPSAPTTPAPAAARPAPQTASQTSSEFNFEQ